MNGISFSPCDRLAPFLERSVPSRLEKKNMGELLEHSQCHAIYMWRQ
jgi:hypothetical protein